MPRLLDLFCGAGGCSMGYHRAGFEVVGVDHRPMPRYPFPFCEGDALELIVCLIRGGYFRARGSDKAYWLSDFDVIHASPPCQAYSVSRKIAGPNAKQHPDLVHRTRAELERARLPWIIENVVGSPLHRPILLCGLMFGLKVLRHRVFESSEILLGPAHPQHPKGNLTNSKSGYSTGREGFVTCAGNNFVRKAGMEAMGIDWEMTRPEVAQAIPPAYTEYLGKQLLKRLESMAARPVTGLVTRL